MPRRTRRQSSRRRHVVRLDGEGLQRHKAKAIINIQENIEGLSAVVQLLDEIACETWAGAEPAELRQATTMMPAALTSINEAVVDVAIGLGELRGLAGLSGITFDGDGDG